MISFSKNNRKRCGILPRIKRGFDEIRKLSKTCFGAYYIKRVFKCPFEMDKKDFLLFHTHRFVSYVTENISKIHMN